MERTEMMLWNCLVQILPDSGSIAHPSLIYFEFEAKLRMQGFDVLIYIESAGDESIWCSHAQL